MRDLFNNVAVRPVIAPADNANLDTTPLVGEVIDGLGFESLTYLIALGALTDANATYAVLLEESDTGAFGGEENDVADEDLLGTEANAGFTFDHDGEVRKLGYIGDKRYTRLTITPTGADSGNSPIAAVAILGNAHNRPVA